MSNIRSQSKRFNSSKRNSFLEDNNKDNATAAHSLQIICPKDKLIEFNYIRGETYSLYNRDLSLKNNSNTHFIQFKVQSNNPSHYKVHPVTAVIPPNKTLQIVIQIMDLDQVADIGPNFFAKFASDKFRISWWAYRQNDRNSFGQRSSTKTGASESIRSDKFCIFQVFIHVHVNICKIEQNSDKQQQMKKPIQLGEKVQQSIEVHRRQLQQLQHMIQERQVQKVEERSMSCSSLMLVAVLAFVVGIIVPF